MHRYIMLRSPDYGGVGIKSNALNDDRLNICSSQGPDYKKILRLSYDVIITYDNRKSNLR